MAANETLRANPHLVGVEGARPYGTNGNMPADAVQATYGPHGQGIRYVSDAPYVLPYEDRPQCAGEKKSGGRCGSKSRSEGSCCERHIDQE